MPTAEAFLMGDAEKFLDEPTAEAFLHEQLPSESAVVPRPGQSERAEAPRTLLQESLAFTDRARELAQQQAREREAQLFTAEEIARLDSGDPARVLMNPLPGLSAPHVSPEDVQKKFPNVSETTAKVLAGLAQTAGGAWDFMASPVGIATGGLAAMAGAPGLVGLAGKSALGTFAVEAGMAMPDAIAQFDEAMRSGDAEAIARTASQLGLNAAVALGAAKGTIDSIKVKPALTEMGKPVPEAPKVDALESSTLPDTVEPKTSPEAGLPPIDSPKVEASSQSAGITPPEGGFTQRVAEFFQPPKRTDLPPLQIDTTHILPRFQPYEAQKLIASSPEGLARVPGLGRLLDARANAATGTDIALITRARSVSEGRTIAAIWAESQYRNRDLFKADESGTIKLTNGERGYISDVIEAEIRDPGSQKISEAQRNWINQEWKPLREDLNKMLTEDGVRELVVESGEGVELHYKPGEDYFPRVAIGKVGVPDATPTGQGGLARPGSKSFSEKSRYYETEFEGARPPQPGELKRQIIYDPDAISRVTKLIANSYRAVADHRLANDPALGAQVKPSATALRKRLEEIPDTIDPETGAPVTGKAAAEAISRDLDAMLAADQAYGIPMWGEFKEVNVAPAFRNKIYPIETAKKLEAAYADNIRSWVKAVETGNSAMKALKATGDVSAPVIQGAAMMGMHPQTWANVAWKSYKALIDPDVRARVFEQKKETVREMAQAGVSLARMEDFLQSGGRGDIVKTFKEGAERLERTDPRAKVITKPIKLYTEFLERTARSYSTFLDLAKIELWEAHRPFTDVKDLPRLGEYIDNILFTGRMENAGMNPHRALGERLMLFAPAYYRGAGNLIATAFMQGAGGNLARKAIGGYAAAQTLLTVGSMIALGLSEDEIVERLNPVKSKFMRVPVSTGDGRNVEVGVGNILSQLVRLTAKGVDYAVNDKAIDTGVEGNPYLRFLQSRAAVMPSLAFEILQGKDYMGNPIGITEAIGRRFMPFAAEALFPREDDATKPQRILDAAFSFMGLNSFPESEYATVLRRYDDMAQTQFDKSYFELGPRERAKVIHEFQQTPEYKKRQATVQDMRRYIELDQNKRERLKGLVSKETRDSLGKLGLEMGTYKNTLTLNGISIPLSHNEQKRLEALMAESFDQRVAQIPEAAKDLSRAALEKWWEGYAKAIREEAYTKFKAELGELKE